ncbi:MAG: hypothetical protein M3025_07075, partial [Actinomycetota bacterium]|nr:hypothetical protein [Actinomycetota bacterium]
MGTVGRISGIRVTAVLACVVLCALLPGVASAHSGTHKPPPFRPRVGNALGIIPRAGQSITILPPSNLAPLLFHGGAVMHGVRVHTVFWAPPGYAFSGAPHPGGHAYQQLIEQFFTDVAHDSGSASNIFSALPQYSDASGAASYSISYDAATDAVSDTAPYPRASAQCTSPTGIVTCVSDASIQQELDRVIRTSDPSARGMHDLWFVFLPPNVDTCITGPVCGSFAFAGYHALSNVGAGGVIYAVAVDPVIGFGLQAPAGSDPQGNPDAEFTVNVAAHELAEAITDPHGNGWLDANGLEIGDKCQNTLDSPLGYAANGAPYNQVINGDEWLFQAIWSN